MRKSAEDTLKTSEHSSSQLLKDSQLLELHLKEMTQKIINATENERRAMSLRLNDEIAQTLLGINIRMIALKNEISANQVMHNHEIAMIQQLVEDSADMIKHLAYEFSVKHL
jgi:signal transduction histidine kinase